MFCFFKYPHLKRHWSFFLFVLCFFALTLKAAPGESPFSDEQLSAITIKALKILHNYHYRQLEFTPKVASDHLKFYIKALDGGNFFLTEEDVKSFSRPPHELFKALLEGNNTIAFAIYKRFLARHSEYKKFAETFLKSKMDFSKDEEFIPDRTKLPRCKNDAELKKLW